MKQLGKYRAVMNVCRRCNDRMHDPMAAIGTDVRLHTEVPLVAFLGLVHLRIARLLFVLRRARRVDDRRIDNRAPAHDDPAVGQMAVHLGKELLAEFMLLDEVAKLTRGRLVGNSGFTQVDSRARAHRKHVVKRLFNSRIAEVEPVLEKIDTEHALQLDGPSPHAIALEIERLDDLPQALPGNNEIHLSKELLASRHLRMPLEAGCRQRHLLAHTHAQIVTQRRELIRVALAGL